MAKNYDNEFKEMIVDLLNSGIKTKQVSEDYNLSLSMIGRWRREYKLKSGDFSKKKELKHVTMERDILKKAVSIFSKSDL